MQEAKSKISLNTKAQFLLDQDVLNPQKATSSNLFANF